MVRTCSGGKDQPKAKPPRTNRSTRGRLEAVQQGHPRRTRRDPRGCRLRHGLGRRNTRPAGSCEKRGTLAQMICSASGYDTPADHCVPLPRTPSRADSCLHRALANRSYMRIEPATATLYDA